MIFDIEDNKYPYTFLALYALIYGVQAVYGTFITIYLDSIGFSKAAIGALMALGPFVAILAQPVWGISSDKAKTKNSILLLMVVGCSFAILIFPFVYSFLFMSLAISLLTFFQSPVLPLCDAITLEHLEPTRWKFGPIRMAGTVGFSIVAVGAGAIAGRNIKAMFPTYFVLSLILVLCVYILPKVKGHQYKGKKVSPMLLFKNKELLLLMGFNLLIQISLAIFNSFFSIFYKDLGANNLLLGWGQFAAAMSEIPFLFFADRIIRKLGIRNTMLLSGVATVIRLLLYVSLSNVYFILFASVFHGFGFIVLQYCLATYINDTIPKELKGSGQAMNGLLTFGFSRIVGSLLGGLLSDRVGIRQTYLFDALFLIGILVVYGIIFFWKRETPSQPDIAYEEV